MRPRARRPLTVPALFAGAAAVLAGLLSGCGEAGDLRSAGPTPTATGPVRLWPDLPPVTAPPYDYGEIDTVPIPGVRVPSGGVRAMDPIAVVRAEARTYPMSYALPDGPPELLADRLTACVRKDGKNGKGATNAAPKPGACPVLTPYYRDLTGDGREELIIGVRLGRQLTEVRVFMPGARKDPRVLTRIMGTSDQLVSVEVAGRDIILRSVSAGIPGYEYRTAWSWDEQHQAMLPTRDEIVRVKPRSDKPVPGASITASASAAGSDEGTGTGTGTGTGSGEGDGTTEDNRP
ncbi:hypothetical protein [Streptomyces qinzhouensis]|uniref:Lipoprotein n=1 Tax=Streptomyces qinzhouensis TaxID=2599401 RepID=A0A5B8JC26_9ACTN|nr:hypothetical protein [Streptomyces qinzhouensis]QDY79007.1 hypothetical protein FQU76_23600 [Streptomyces qinzhouensis]